MQIAHPDMSDFSDYDKNLYVVCAGYNKACDADLGCVRENGRTDWFLYYVIKGKSKYAFKKNEHIAVADDVVFYNYKEPQDYVHLAEYGTEVYWIHFKGNLVQSLLNELGINQSMRVHVDENLSFYFKTIINALTYKKSNYPKITALNAQLILLAVSRCMNTRSDKDEIFEQVLSMMNDCNYSKMGLAEYSQMCNLCPSQFARKFKKYTGESLVQYKNNILIKKAKWYLKYSDYSISEIAGLLNIENVYYFSNLFKKSMGLSPIKYRNLFRK